ncbi:MAG: ABC transporter substrate-binding protein [Actinomycetota bacterium]|nr:ABC transporter substrate-binding protein [Actinomycetota bacterium]
MRKVIVLVLFAAAACGGSPRSGAVTIGAVYPLTGPQGAGGVEESRGVRVAVELVNQAGGVGGHPIRVRWVDTPGSDAAPGAIKALADDGIRLVIGSHGSTISRPAADAAANRGMLFWETGAVGDMTGNGAGDLVFRVSPTGGVLGRAAVEFIADRLAPLMRRRAASLRFAVAYVDDVYGSSVAGGAIRQIRDMGLAYAGAVSYNAQTLRPADVVHRIAQLRPDVLFVTAYIDDGVALRKESIRQHLPLVASIGTSSSYCHPEFGARLGKAATGLFASDKPNSSLNPAGLSADSRAVLERANTLHRRRYGAEMDAPGLAGFAAAWALFHEVMPRATTFSPSAIAEAARAVRIPRGGLPNGSGLEFGAPGTPEAGANMRAMSVIWEWTTDGKRTVVWPPEYATAPIQPLRIA